MRGRLTAALVLATLLAQGCVGQRLDRPTPPVPTLAPPAPAPRASVPIDSRAILFGIDEGLRNDRLLAESGARWQRLVMPWTALQPNGPGDFSRLGHTLPADVLEAQLNRGLRIAGLLQFTPRWAQTDPSQGERSPPRNLDLAFDDPQNYFGRFAFETARHYAGRIDEWIVWNEPEFRPGEPGVGNSYSWLGTEEQFAQLLKVGYRAIKSANPNATVSFAGTSYWTDELAHRGQYYERVLAILARDPAARREDFFHDAVALNLYRTPDDLVRIHGVFKDIQRRQGIDKPVWLSETNAMPTDDLQVKCDHAADAIKTTMDQQAAFAIQAFALAAAAGYRRIGFYQMVDDDPCRQPGVWGAARDDGSRRPVADALRTAMTTFGNARTARFVPLARLTEAWPAWPANKSSYVPNWEIYQVALDLPDNRRVTVVWNGDARSTCAGVKKNGASVRVLDKLGVQHTAPTERDGWWWLSLGPASARVADDPDGYFFIGGDPLLLVEEGVAAGTRVIEPTSGCANTPGFVVAVAPAAGQTVHRGETAEFTVQVRGAAVGLHIVEWSSQRFPTPKPPDNLPLRVSVPATVVPGQPGTVRVETAGADTGIYYLTLQATAAGTTQTFEIALVVD